MSLIIKLLNKKNFHTQYDDEDNNHDNKVGRTTG